MDRLLHILRDLHPEVDFNTADDLVDGGILDSFDIVNLVSEIEDGFGVLIPPQALLPEHFQSAQALYALIRQLEEA